MRGRDERQDGMFSYISLDTRVPNNHPLRPIRGMVDEALKALSRDFDRLYAQEGRPSIVPERLLRARTLQVLYSGGLLQPSPWTEPELAAATALV